MSILSAEILHSRRAVTTVTLPITKPHSTSWLDARMIESALDTKMRLTIYETVVDENKFQLLDISL